MPRLSYEDLILVLIYKTSGKWTWYQLQRALDLRGLGGEISVVKVTNKLILEGFIQSKAFQESNPTYHISEQGRSKVEYLLQKYGSELFEAKDQNPDDFELQREYCFGKCAST